MQFAEASSPNVERIREQRSDSRQAIKAVDKYLAENQDLAGNVDLDIDQMGQMSLA